MFSRIQISSLTVTEYEFTASVIQFLGVVFVPVGDFDDDVGGAVGDGLAAEARLGGDAGGFVELVEFGVGGFVAGFEALVNDDVAGGAGADAAAGVVKAGFEAFGNVEDAAREAVVAVGNLLRVDLDGFAAGKKGDFVFLRCGFVFDFFDVWVAAAHDIPQKTKDGDAKPPLHFAMLNLPAADRAAITTVWTGSRPIGTGSACPKKPLNLGQLAAFERRGYS